MLFTNRCTLPHAVDAAARLTGLDREQLFSLTQRQTLDGCGNPCDLQ